MSCGIDRRSAAMVKIKPRKQPLLLVVSLCVRMYSRSNSDKAMSQAQRQEDLYPQVVGIVQLRNARNGVTQNAVSKIRVLPHKAWWMDENPIPPNSLHHFWQFIPAVLIKEVVMQRQASGVAQNSSNRRGRGVSREPCEFRRPEVVIYRAVQVNFLLLQQLHHRGCGKRLRYRSK